MRRKAQKSKRRVLPAFSGEKMQTGLNRFFFPKLISVFSNTVCPNLQKKKKKILYKLNPKEKDPRPKLKCSVPSAVCLSYLIFTLPKEAKPNSLWCQLLKTLLVQSGLCDPAVKGFEILFVPDQPAMLTLAVLSPWLAFHIDYVLRRSFSCAHPDGILPPRFPRTCRHNPLPSTGGSRAEATDLLQRLKLLPSSPFAWFAKGKADPEVHACMKTFLPSTSLLIPICKGITSSLPWCLCWSPVYRRTEGSFQKMKEGSVFPGLVASEGRKKTKLLSILWV